MRRLTLVPLLLALLLVPLGCDSASRTERQVAGACPVELTEGAEPGEECVVADECRGFCCKCPAAGDFEAQVCLGDRCATEAETCNDAVARGELCN